MNNLVDTFKGSFAVSILTEIQSRVEDEGGGPYTEGLKTGRGLNEW